MKISVIIPCFNESNTIISILKKVNLEKEKFNLEIIISDDGSTDNTVKLLKENSTMFDKLIETKSNKGKGHALRKKAGALLELRRFTGIALEFVRGIQTDNRQTESGRS